MGRRGRHKKIKSCDPFYKGPRTGASLKSDNIRTSDGGPDEQAIPRKLKDFMKQSVKRKDTKKPGKKFQQGAKGKPGLKFQQRVGESEKDYFNRIDRETATAMAKSMLDTRPLRDRRKKHLQGRKEKIKDRRVKKSEHERDNANFEDEVRFGEVVQQPPSLTSKPRKAPQDKSTKSLLLHSLLTKKNGDKSDQPKNKKRKHMTPQEQARFDQERERVITAYRMAKKMKLEGNS